MKFSHYTLAATCLIAACAVAPTWAQVDSFGIGNGRLFVQTGPAQPTTPLGYGSTAFVEMFEFGDASAGVVTGFAAGPTVIEEEFVFTDALYADFEYATLEQMLVNAPSGNYSFPISGGTLKNPFFKPAKDLANFRHQIF